MGEKKLHLGEWSETKAVFLQPGSKKVQLEIFLQPVPPPKKLVLVFLFQKKVQIEIITIMDVTRL